MTVALSDLVRVEDPDFYDDTQFEVYDRMRLEAPAYRYDPLDVHLLTRMADVREASTHPELFSNAAGLTLNQLRMARAGASAAFERFNEPDGELVITKDPPRQREIRSLMAPTMTPRYLARFRERLDGYCAELLDRVEPGESFDFVDKIAMRLPLYAAGVMLGVEEVDLPRWQGWVSALEELTNVEDVADLEEPGTRFDDLKDFLRGQLAAKRRSPGEDMISLMLQGELDGAPVSDAVVLTHISTLMSNGGTTRLLLTSLADLLARNPDQLALIRSDPERLDVAIEEALRLAPPARGFVRTLTGEAEVGGARLQAGDRVYLLYPAANRDPALFADPERFDVTRPQSGSHAAFGFGTHFCLGAALARLEARLLFSQLLSRFGQLHLEGERQRYRHVQLNGWADLPISLDR
jgi:cytochrome P450